MKLSYFILKSIDMEETESFYTDVIGMHMVRKFEKEGRECMVMLFVILSQCSNVRLASNLSKVTTIFACISPI